MFIFVSDTKLINPMQDDVLPIALILSFYVNVTSKNSITNYNIENQLLVAIFLYNQTHWSNGVN